MRFTASTTPPTHGTRRGVTYTAFQTNPVARTRAIPIQPQPNAQVTANSALAQCAAFWATLSPTQQATWSPAGPDPTFAYANFIQQNQLNAAWGLALFPTWPGFYTGPGIVFAQPYAEPDGIHTTMVAIASGPPSGGHEVWCRLYVGWKPITPTNDQSGVTMVFAGSFGPVSSDNVSLFDFTGVMAAFLGQWVPNECIDTASETTCGGGSFNASLYATDQVGNISDFGGPYPFSFEMSIGPGAIGPGVCPLPSSPPYPWPTAYDYYADTQPFPRSAVAYAASLFHAHTFNFPTPSVAGDLCVIGMCTVDVPATPSGWTLQASASSGAFTASGLVYSKILTSADITAGGVSFTFGSLAQVTVQIYTFIGATGGIREVEISAATSTTSVTTSAANAATDTNLYLSGGVAATTPGGTDVPFLGSTLPVGAYDLNFGGGAVCDPQTVAGGVTLSFPPRNGACTGGQYGAAVVIKAS